MEKKYYITSLEHILAELERIDLLIRAQVQSARAIYQTDSQFQGLYISEQEVDALLARPAGLPTWVHNATAHAARDESLGRLKAQINRKKYESEKCGVTLRLQEMIYLFELTPFDIDIVLICLAPELDLRYERLYAYLQDDVTKKRPSIDLILNVCCQTFDDKITGRKRLEPNAPLIRNQLLTIFEEPSQQHPPLLGKYLKLEERVANYLLDSDAIDWRLQPYVHPVLPKANLERLVLSNELKQQMLQLVVTSGIKQAPILYFQGPYGVGKQITAEALCREWSISLLVVDGKSLLSVDSIDFEMIVRLIAREALLQNTALYWSGFDALLHVERFRQLEVLTKALAQQTTLSFIAGDMVWEPADMLHEKPFLRVVFSRPSYTERLRLWTQSLQATEFSDDVDLGAIAGRFRFTGGQIRDAAATARNLGYKRNPKEVLITSADLFEACRLQSNRKLASLAQKIVPHYTWDDIVLPTDQLQQLRETFNTVKYRAKVHSDWGFGKRLSLGKGLNILFAGPSGTGKTMAADIIAGELGLDLYKIDLSMVVSKYIGETEKNLSRIFTEAETANAILFFDEADALFGKRSEVHDSHDRYANIEISYLLQKMEEYEGVVILATNFRKNLDAAFVRRMHFTIDFRFPNAQEKFRIWQRIWPKETPRSPELNFRYMANKFEVTGGNIRNIALAAAFLAADDGGVITMNHLMHATQREYQKMGKVMVKDEFNYSDGYITEQ